MRWSLSEFRGIMILLGVATLVYAALDVWVAWYFGVLLDTAAQTGREEFFAEHWGSLLLALLVFCLLRPGAQILQSALQSLSLGPSLTVRALWRLHRHTLGQTLGFFQDDFAGRIASKQMQTTGALVNATMDTIMALGMLIVYVAVMSVVLIGTSWWLSLLTLLWIGGLALYIASQLQLIRTSAKTRAEARAAVNGRFVDSFTNFATVKLFAHESREESYARDGLTTLHEATVAFGRAAMRVRIGLNVINTLGYRTGRAGGAGRAVGGGEIHHRQRAAAPLRYRGWPPDAGWPRHPRCDAGKPARANRRGDAGNGDVQPLRPRQYPLRLSRRSRCAGGGGRGQGGGAIGAGG